MIETVTTRSLILQVADLWHEQYQRMPHDSEKAAIGRRLRAIDSQIATAEEVAAIIGNTTWTDILCNICGANVTEAVMLGEPPREESATILICGPCLRKASSLLPENGTPTSHKTSLEATHRSGNT